MRSLPLNRYRRLAECNQWYVEGQAIRFIHAMDAGDQRAADLAAGEIRCFLDACDMTLCKAIAERAASR